MKYVCMLCMYVMYVCMLCMHVMYVCMLCMYVMYVCNVCIGPATRCDEMGHFAAILKGLEAWQPIEAHHNCLL